MLKYRDKNCARAHPVGFMQYFKHGSREVGENGFKTKMELAVELVDECEEMGMAAENYVFDA